MEDKKRQEKPKIKAEIETDEELAKRARAKDPAAIYQLIEQYDRMIARTAEPFYIQGGDREDLQQEGRMGLLYAIKDYDPEKNDCFEAFARLCIRRQIIRAVERANRKKHRPLNEAISMEGIREDVEKGYGNAVLPEDRGNPEEQIVDEEAREEMERRLLAELSSMERDVFLLMLQGYEYQSISEILNRPIKSIDNAMQRIRKKAKQIQG